MDKPLVLITLAYTIGIVLAKNLAIPLELSALLLLIFMALTIYALLNRINLSRLILLLFVLFGIFFFQFRAYTVQDKLFNYANGKYLTITGSINEPPKQSEGATYFPLKVDEPERGKAFVFVRGGGKNLNYGDRLKVRGMLERKSGVSNPLMPEMTDQLSINAY